MTKPMDIEIIRVLKDADATSIYGSRAANGAILITRTPGDRRPGKRTTGTILSTPNANYPTLAANWFAYSYSPGPTSTTTKRSVFRC
jgi:TonB-dependent SusC/RagA subfamily outer membrane receptor